MLLAVREQFSLAHLPPWHQEATAAKLGILVLFLGELCAEVLKAFFKSGDDLPSLISSKPARQEIGRWAEWRSVGQANLKR